MSDLQGRWLMQDVRPGAAAVFELSSQAGELRQLMRWVAEPRLDIACWVSATPCSWQLWQIVMVGEPTADLAVSQNKFEIAVVAQDSIDAYLARLSSCLQGDLATLLNDSEWDAACRMGKQQGLPFLSAQRERPMTVDHVVAETHAGLYFAVRHSD